MTRVKPVRSVALTLVTATLALACGQDDSEPPAEETPPPPPGVFGMAPLPYQGVPSVVTLQTRDGAPATPPADAAVIDQLGLAFTPTQIVARVGQTIRITNSETLAHNVHLTFMDTDSTVFLADLGPEQQTELTLDQEGGYDVTCDEHPGMRAFLFVTSAPYAAIADVEGRFSIPDASPGTYEASLWTVPTATRSQRTVDVSGPSTELDLTAPQ